jgi:hypothetical protein
MRAYYVIYSHTQNAWYTENRFWYTETNYTTKQIPVGFSISVGNNVSGTNATVNEYANVVVQISDITVDPYGIKKFHTLNEAETYLLSGDVNLYNSNEFLTIRKIYMK